MSTAFFIVKFAYNNAKNIKIDYTFFEFHSKYYYHIFYKKNSIYI